MNYRDATNFRDKVDVKILQFDRFRAFVSISQETDFFRVWYLYRNITNNMDFYYRPNLEKSSNYQLFSKAWGILISNLISNPVFLTNKALSHTSSYRLQTLFQSLEKTNNPIQSCSNRQNDGKKDWQTLFTLPATAGGPIILKF